MRGVRAALLERAIAAARANDDGLGLDIADGELLSSLLGAAQEALEQRYRPSTRKLDRSYWRKWKEWCALVRTPPLR
eukprot:1888729-Pleurochrysis_carterae.AAC.1